MKKFITFLAILMVFPIYSFADRLGEQQVILQKRKTNGAHNEYYQMADMPDAVYYDSESGEIVIEADGTSLCNVSVQFLKYCHL